MGPAMRFESVRAELDKVLERLARLEALSEEDQSWRERTFQRMEQSLMQHGEEIRRFSCDLEAQCSANGLAQHQMSKELFAAQEQFRVDLEAKVHETVMQKLQTSFLPPGIAQPALANDYRLAYNALPIADSEPAVSGTRAMGSEALATKLADELQALREKLRTVESASAYALGETRGLDDLSKK